MGMAWDEMVMREIIRKAIREGKLYELVFTDAGRRLWKTYPEDRFKRMVKEEISKKEGDR